MLEVVSGNYVFSLPIAYFPDYKSLKLSDKLYDFVYAFSYQVKIMAGGKISKISIPEHATITERNESNSCVTVKSERTSRIIDLHYRTSDMMSPQLLYAENATNPD